MNRPLSAKVGAGERPLSLLLVEDDRGDALLVEELIADAAIEIDFHWSPTLSHAATALEVIRPDCVLLDLHLPDAGGVDALDRLGALAPSLPIVVLTSHGWSFHIRLVSSGQQITPLPRWIVANRVA